MKNFLQSALRLTLKKLAQLTIWRYRPGVVGVTGSVGKTSAKLAIASVLQKERDIRVAHGNFNNELGLPLTIIGPWTEIRGWFFWPRVIVRGLAQIIWKTRYPELLVLEYGVDRPGDLKYLLSIARPNVSVITAVGDVPVHVEFFNGPAEVAREKARLIECLPSAGYAILNQDDLTVMGLADRTRARTITFGFSRDADLHIMKFENRSENGKPVGITMKFEYGGSSVPVRLEGAFGKPQAYAAAAAAAAGIVFGMNLVKISEALKAYQPPTGRMRLLSGIKGSFILDDAYNASPLSMHAALDTLEELPGKRKIAVLGDMLEIGSYAIEAHERVGKLAAKRVNILFTVGPRGKLIADAARVAGLLKKNIYVFETADEAHEPLQNAIRKGDLILVKASRAIHLEKVVEEIRALES